MRDQHKCMQLDGDVVDEMSCRKGVWKFDTLWEHPLGKGEERHAIHHRVVQFDAQKIGREHSTCCEKNLCIVTSLRHNILLVFGLAIL